MTHKPRQPLGLASKVWGIIEEPKSVTLVQALIVYTAAIWGGIMTLIYPPISTSLILGDGLMTFIAALMVFSGAVGIVTAVAGYWWVERTLGVGLLLLAGATYIYTAIESQIIEEGSRYLQLSWLTIAAGGLIIRYLRIRKANYDPIT